MSVVAWIIFGVVAVITTWLAIDTIIWIIKRIKAKKGQKNEIKNADKSDN